MMHMANYWDNIDQGKTIGMQQGITALIATCREFDMKDEEIINRLMDYFSLSEDEAIEKLNNN